MFINERDLNLHTISVQSTCCFLFTVEKDTSSVVKGEWTGGGLAESNSSLWVGWEENIAVTLPCTG